MVVRTLFFFLQLIICPLFLQTQVRAVTLTNCSLICYELSAIINIFNDLGEKAAGDLE